MMARLLYKDKAPFSEGFNDFLSATGVLRLPEASLINMRGVMEKERSDSRPE